MLCPRNDSVASVLRCYTHRGHSIHITAFAYVGFGRIATGAFSVFPKVRTTPHCAYAAQDESVAPSSRNNINRAISQYQPQF